MGGRNENKEKGNGMEWKYHDAKSEDLDGQERNKRILDRE
jgi:hypothetical protein